MYSNFCSSQLIFFSDVLLGYPKPWVLFSQSVLFSLPAMSRLPGLSPCGGPLLPPGPAVLGKWQLQPNTTWKHLLVVVCGCTGRD